MNIPAMLLEFAKNYLFNEGVKLFLASDFMVNVYFFVALVLIGVAWRKYAWFRLLGSLYTEYYQWAEDNLALPGSYKLKKYMERLNEKVLQLKGRPMTTKEVEKAKITADALAAKDHVSKAQQMVG